MKQKHVEKQEAQEERERRLAEAAYRNGRESGIKEGMNIARQAAFSDLQGCWNQIAQFAQAASNYAAQISHMYKSREGKDGV